MFKEITQISRYKQGYVAYGISDGGGNITANLCDVRAAITEPMADIPCYYLILGMLDKENMHGKRPVMFISEYENKSTTKVFNQLMDDIVRLSIQTLYANYENDGFYASLWRHRQLSSVDVSLKPVISGKNIEYGDALIGGYIQDQALITPQTVKPMMSQQTNEINSMGYNTEKIDYNSFYAWNALRYILAGFTKNPPLNRGRLAQNDIGNPAKWDSKPSALGAKFTDQNPNKWAV
jgi:hypothetical protein